jgi:hypothetical protein
MNNDADNVVMNSDASPSNEEALDILVTTLRREHGGAISAVLYYGSCLRSNNPFDGIVDFYLITDSYSDMYSSRIRAFLNWMLPPNVFYKELDVGNRILRVKYNVLSTNSLRRGLSSRRIHSYFWGRFCQPMKILWSRDDDAHRDVESHLQQAVKTFLDRVIPRAPATGAVAELWMQGLGLSYGAELRSESPDRARELVSYALDHYVAATIAAAPTLRFSLAIEGTGENVNYSARVPKSSRMFSRWGWMIRRVLGKFLSMARLIKSLLTFEGGLDYAAWKLERHSGQRIEIPDRVRQHPLIFVWPLLWKLYRRGVIR